MSTRIITRTATALGDAIVEAGLAAGLPEEKIAPKPKPAVRRQRKGKNLTQTVGLGWEHDIANLTITVEEGDCLPAEREGSNTWAQLKFTKYQPKQLTVSLELDQLEDDLLKYIIRDGDQEQRFYDRNLPVLTIPVTWNEKGRPEMRQKDVDNCDILLINEFGLGIQLQVSAVVRSGFSQAGKPWWKIFVQLQEMQSLQIVTTTPAKAEELGLTSVPTDQPNRVATVIPLFAVHNRPGTDWLGIKNSARFGAEEVVPTCLKEGRFDRLSNAFYEEWEAPELGEPTREGAVRGVVSFYNLIWNGGSGFAEMVDGTSAFVHWKQLRKVHALEPMTVVEFYLHEHKGKKQAKAVMVV